MAFCRHPGGGAVIIAYLIYGYQPQAGASPDTLVAFYVGERVWILIAAIVSGLAMLNLMWFAAAVRATLADAGLDGWGAAATAASAAFGALFLLLITLTAGLAYSIAGPGNIALTSGLNDLAWATVVLSSFPRAMMIMSAAFGTVAGEVDLQRPVRGGSCRRGAGLAGRHHLAEWRILGARRRLFAAGLAPDRSCMDPGREPRSLGPEPRYPRRVVMEGAFLERRSWSVPTVAVRYLSD